MLNRLIPAFLFIGSAQAAELAPSSCPPPAYTPEARRYEMEGTVKLEFALDKNGAPIDIRVLQSSDYALLERESIKQVHNCKFADVNAPAGARHTATMVWRLQEGRPEVLPRFLPQTCQTHYKIFSPKNSDYLTVRTQVWPDGRPYTAKIENGSGDKEVDALAISYVEQCRFEPAQHGNKAVHGAALLKLPFDRSALDEAKIRATYDVLATGMARQNQYRVAHILYASEDAAVHAIATIQAGTPFGAIARRESLDKASGKVDGELGWVNPSQMVTEFAGALRAQDNTGLIAKPIRTAFGWHLILVEEVRPATPPSYEAVRDRLRSKLLKETEVLVQAPPPIQR